MTLNQENDRSSTKIKKFELKISYSAFEHLTNPYHLAVYLELIYNPGISLVQIGKNRDITSPTVHKSVKYLLKHKYIEVVSRSIGLPTIYRTIK